MKYFLFLLLKEFIKDKLPETIQGNDLSLFPEKIKKKYGSEYSFILSVFHCFQIRKHWYAIKNACDYKKNCYAYKGS